MGFCDTYIFAVVKYVFAPPMLDDPAGFVSIAVAHSVFNVFCTVVLFPMSGLLEKIGHELTESAKLRLENHSASLSELASMHEPPITKSTLNNRFAKIMKMAENIANRK